MRCPSCGTENEPDSRFCGGCGARLAGESRIAPTQKIDTGAQPVQQPVAHRTPSPEIRIPDSRPPASRPPDSRPPRGISGSQNVPPASFPLTPSVQRPPQSKPQPVQATPPPGSRFGPSNGASAPIAGSASIVPPQRRVGLIIAILLVDLALAGAGAYLLIEGLSSPEATPAAPAQPSAALGVTAPPPDAAIEDAALVVTPIPDDAPAVAIVPDAAPAPAPAKKPAARKKLPERAKTTTQPVDPYDERGSGPVDPFPPDLPPPPPSP